MDALRVGSTYTGCGKVQDTRRPERENSVAKRQVKVVRRNSSSFMEKVACAEIAKQELESDLNGTVEIFRKGTLEKQSTNGKYQQRYFVLTGSYFRYYANQKSYEKSGLANAKAFMELRLVHQCTVGISEKDPPATSLEQLRTINRETKTGSKRRTLILLRMNTPALEEITEIAFRAPSEAAAMEWAIAINKTIGAQFNPAVTDTGNRKMSLSERYDKTLVATNPFARKNYVPTVKGPTPGFGIRGKIPE